MMLYSCLMTPPFSLAKALALKTFVSIKAFEIIGNGHTFPAPQRGRWSSEWSREMLVRILLKIKLSSHCREAWFQIARYVSRWRTWRKGRGKVERKIEFIEERGPRGRLRIFLGEGALKQVPSNHLFSFSFSPSPYLSSRCIVCILYTSVLPCYLKMSWLVIHACLTWDGGFYKLNFWKPDSH